MAERTKNRWAGVLIGPAITVISVVALWKNETRFDYYKAASSTSAIESFDGVPPNKLFSFTGAMDRGATMDGEYVDSFRGYLMVQREAEIYCWDHETGKNSDRWELEWMSHVDSNSRNSGISQQLSSRKFLPSSFLVGELNVQGESIEFCDSSVSIPPSSLELKRHGLQSEGPYFYLRRGASTQLGDERISYSGIVIPETATYFGKYDSGQGVADTSQRRTGWINGMIGDTGILHFIVAGDRKTALSTMKRHLFRVKWLVRLIGTALVVLGIFVLFATILGFLLSIPVIGQIAEGGALVLALAIGLPIAFLTIVVSYLIAHPFLLAAILGVTLGGAYWLRIRGGESQAALKKGLDEQYGYKLENSELKEMEFLELAQLAMHDRKLAASEQQFLRKWALKHRWSETRYDEMIERAKLLVGQQADSVYCEKHLHNLIRLSLADGQLTRYEFNSIKHVASFLGIDDTILKATLKKVRSEANRAVAS